VSIDWADWIIPAVSGTAAVFWTLVLIRGLRGVMDHRPSNVNARIGTLAVLATVATSLTFSSLIYPDVIGAEGARTSVTLARVALLVGGIAVWWLGRHPEERTA